MGKYKELYQEMGADTKTIKVVDWLGIPPYFTGIVEYPDGTKQWYSGGELIHQEWG